MHKLIVRVSIVALASVALAISAQAQGKGKDKDKGKDKHDERDRGAVVNSGGEVLLPVQTNRIPPGLAKKPGQMPPGQYKKHYTVTQGSSVLSQILGQNGYVVQRVVPAGTSRYVYYRGTDGLVHRAVVRPGTNQPAFSNVPSSLLQLVLSRLQ
jgi:hypothetical protein